MNCPVALANCIINPLIVGCSRKSSNCCRSAIYLLDSCSKASPSDKKFAAAISSPLSVEIAARKFLFWARTLAAPDCIPEVKASITPDISLSTGVGATTPAPPTADIGVFILPGRTPAPPTPSCSASFFFSSLVKALVSTMFTQFLNS